ncbi:hypothetical protein G6O67_005128 [Ophiocordyceps sinensis]|uniref:Uncharacterized protein n=1 Tax=Ophiocordyceps sinensis TaxID=72228 RepID=A0A8H4PR24_9HYPO|nr:hypothetical protein G6O67_005128 [Ophiocordyceps sinensis]
MPRATTNGNVPTASEIAEQLLIMLNACGRNAPALTDAQLCDFGDKIYRYYCHWDRIATRFRNDLDRLHALWLEKQENDVEEPSRRLNRVTGDIAITQLISYSEETSDTDLGGVL